MENYSQFMERINSFEISDSVFCEGDFSPDKSLAMKVNRGNRFSGFYGDTVLFELGNFEKALTADIVHALYAETPECFSERIWADTFHVTLHDLSSSSIPDKAVNEAYLNRRVLNEILLRTNIQHQTIEMQSRAIFNMVNTSLVMGLYPVSEKEYEKLMSLYNIIDEVKQLTYPLTPHITLAYYSINGFTENSVKRLESVIKELNKSSFSITLDTHRLFYKHFNSMNDYMTIMRIVH